MRALPFAVVLMLVGCHSSPERQRRGGGASAAGSGGTVAPEADAAQGGAGGEAGEGGTGGSVPDSAAGTGGSGGRRDASADGRTSDASSPDAAPVDLARDSRGDLPRDLAADLAAADAALAPDTSLPADSATTDGSAGDPEPGRLAGITRLHNQVRATIPVPPLTWDPALAATAAAAAAECMFDHSSTQGVGENLAAFAPPGNRTAKAPVDGWASEAADYDYATNSCAPGTICGHYTQMVWRTSVRLGCAFQACSQNSPFDNVTNWELWVCQYSPPGNIVGRKPY